MKIKEIITKPKRVETDRSWAEKCSVIEITLEEECISIEKLEKLTQFIESL